MNAWQSEREYLHQHTLDRLDLLSNNDFPHRRVRQTLDGFGLRMGVVMQEALDRLERWL